MTARLVKNGFISFEQAELAGDLDGTPSPLRLTEVLGYFGSIALFIATIALMIDVAVSDDLLLDGINSIPGGFVALIGAVLLFAVGYRLTDHEEGAIKRSGGMTLASGFGLWAIASNLLLQEIDAADVTPLLVIVPVVVAAVLVYRRHESVPTQLTLFFTTVQALNAVLVLIQINEWVSTQDQVLRIAVTGNAPQYEWIGMAFQAGLGIAWIWITHKGLLRPRNTGFVVGTLFAGVQGYVLFGTDDGWIILFAAIAGFAIYGGVAWRSSVLLGLGAIGLLIFVNMMVAILVDEITAVSIAVWFGVPGLAAVGYSLFSLDRMAKEEAVSE